MTDHVLIDQQDSIRIIKLNRPEKKNALTIAMYDEISNALQDADADPNTRAIILTTAGEDFTSGNDLMDFMANPDLDETNGPARFIYQIAKQKKPLIAAVEGLAVGVGATMLLHCDFVYMSNQASLIFPFINLALVPEAGSSLLLPRLIGHTKAAEMLMLGEPVSAETADSLGMVTRLCEVGGSLDLALITAKKLASKAPEALLKTKALMTNGNQDLHSQMGQELLSFKERLQSPELAEAIQAFMQKRAPSF